MSPPHSISLFSVKLVPKLMTNMFLFLTKCQPRTALTPDTSTMLFLCSDTLRVSKPCLLDPICTPDHQKWCSMKLPSHYLQTSSWKTQFALWQKPHHVYQTIAQLKFKMPKLYKKGISDALRHGDKVGSSAR